MYHIEEGFMTVTDWFCQNYITRNHEKYCCICIDQNIGECIFKQRGANTDYKFSYNSRTRPSVDNLVRYSLTSLE